MRGLEQGAGQSPRVNTAIETVVDRLNGVRDSLIHDRERLERLVDRALGGDPKAQGGPASQAPRAVKPGYVGSLQDRLDEIAEVGSVVQVLIDKLEGVI